MCDICRDLNNRDIDQRHKQIPLPYPPATAGGNKARFARSGGHKSQGMSHQLFSINTSEIELTTLQRSGKKQLDKLRRIREAMDSSPWLKARTHAKCAETTGRKATGGQVVDSILAEGGNKPCLGDERNYNILAVSKWRGWSLPWAKPMMEAGRWEFRDMHAQQLKHLSEGTRSLEEAVCWGSVPGVMDARKELLLNLKRLKKNLTQQVRGSSMKTSLMKIWEKKGLDQPKALDSGNKFLEESGAEHLQEIHLKSVQDVIDRIIKLVQLGEALRRNQARQSWRKGQDPLMAQSLLCWKDPHITKTVYNLMQKAREVTQRGQSRCMRIFLWISSARTCILLSTDIHGYMIFLYLNEFLILIFHLYFYT